MIDSTSQVGLERLHEAMAARVAKGELPGMVTLVAKGDDVFVDAIGVTGFGGEDPMRRDTPFRITSMTKPILALATMMLVEQGRLALDEPVERLLPELADRRVLRRIDGPLDDTVPARRPITVDDLLTFRMGHGLIMEPTFDPPYPIVTAARDLELVMGPPDPRTPHDPNEWLRRFATLPLIYQPGERWQYNTGSLVLSVLVARASGQPLADFFKTRIFDPLAMKQTAFWVSPEQAKRLPSRYQTNFQTGKLEQQTISGPSVWTVPPPFPSGAAGLVSTIDDYLAFARLLIDGGVHENTRLLSERSVRLMTTNHLTPEQVAGGGLLLGGQGWGYGMSVITVPDEVSSVPGRYGWNGGYGTYWSNDPSQSLVAIAMTQTTDFIFNGAMTEFAKLATNSLRSEGRDKQ
ncbi:MAG: beta-lactamase family protein [Chloroflexi bacterium]|nr:MAG: beta-lactamase family protein [Chloroflexota bacterium]